MKLFEVALVALQPVSLPLHREVRRRLLKIVRVLPHRPDVLDVGGRKSPYTVGVPASVTISDLPRETALQWRLDLGVSKEVMEATHKRRTNISRIVIDDMTSSRLESNAFDCVVSVEVLEHVERDALFLQGVHRVLKPGGVFLMTTPNGDFVKIPTNPDHKRHYTREELRRLLSSVFEDVEVDYAIAGGKFRKLGLRGWSVKRPVQTSLSMLGNFINAIQSASPSVGHQVKGTRHLIAVARKTN